MVRALQSVVRTLAAVVVSIALSGAPQAIASLEPVHGHRCQCPVRHGVHDCDCPLCHLEASRLGADAADDPSLPPCHRAMAKKARARSQETSQRQAERGPCLTSACGTPDGPLRPPPTAEQFLIPEGPRVALLPTSAELGAPGAVARTAALDPETPPPRRPSLVAA